MRDGIVATLEKTFVSIGYSPHLKFRTLLECLKHFTTSSEYKAARVSERIKFEKKGNEKIVISLGIPQNCAVPSS